METTNEFDYLMTSKDTEVLKNLSQMGEYLEKLKVSMEEAQAKADLAKKEYEHYANNILPAAMFAAGVESLSLANGNFLKVNRQYYCKPNKNPEDQQALAQWLKENGGENLIESTVETGPDSISALESAGIPYAETTKVNSNKLKSFIKDKLGITSGIAQLDMEDIPKFIHFQEISTVELKAN